VQPVGGPGVGALLRAGVAALGDEQQLAVRLEQVEHPLAERHQALGGRGARPERRLAADERVLEGAVALGQQRARERRAIAEAPEQRALADARLGRDGVHRRAAHAVLGEQLLGRGEDPPAVARGVRPLGRVVADDRELDRGERVWGGHDGLHDADRTAVRFLCYSIAA
jgi:hypothetical protein